MSWHGGDHDREGVGRIAAERRRMRQQRNKLVEFIKRTRPAMRQQQGQWRGSLAWFVDEVHLNVIDRHFELLEAVEKRLLPAPIVGGAPIADEILKISQIGSQCPPGTRNLV